jgi:hypothetical protein
VTSFRENNGEFSRFHAVKLVGKTERLADGTRRGTFEAVKYSPDGIDVRSTVVIRNDSSKVESSTEETLTYEGSDRTFLDAWKSVKEVAEESVAV